MREAFIQMREPHIRRVYLFSTSRCERSSCSRDGLACGFTVTALSGSGRTSRGNRGGPAGLPWCHTTAVANRLLPISQRQKLTFPEALPAGGRLPPQLAPHPPPLRAGGGGVAVGEKIPKRWLKTTMRQLCQHGRPSPRKHFDNNRRRGAKLTLNTGERAATPPRPPAPQQPRPVPGNTTMDVL